MYTTYITNADELKKEFVESLKKNYKGKQIEIIVHELDETEYLTRSIANKKHLEESITEVESGNTIKVEIEDLK